jgi:hypothetical protein
VAQPAVPWSEQPGCYMDADGNGVVNNLDAMPIKLNWLKKHTNAKGGSPVGSPSLTFDLGQNYPNPFNPSTSIRYSIPEAGHVTLVVTDHLGRAIATLVEADVQSGTHDVTFDASSLSSGSYFATVSMSGRESGLSFSKSIRMTLLK